MLSVSGLEQNGDGEDSANSVPASVRAADALRARILGGELPAGTALREGALAAALDVSRNTLREALRQLLSEGLIEQALYRGAMVRKMSHADVRDIFAVRRVVQIRAVELSTYASQLKLDALDRWASDGEKRAKTGDWLAVGTASLRFHLAIVSLIGSPLLDRFFETIMAQLSLALEGRRSEEAFQAQWVPRNREICNLLNSGRRPEAMRALGSFIDDSERIVLDIVRANGTATDSPPADRVRVRNAGNRSGTGAVRASRRTKSDGGSRDGS